MTTMIFLTNVLSYALFFVNRQYPVAIINRTIHKAFSTDCITALTPKTCAANDRIPFTITFHSVDNSVN